MRFVLIALVVLGGALTGCGPPRDTSMDAFYERHPEYNNRPSYFDKDPGYDDTDLNERYSGSKD